jgi:tRNA dimethylallyltransferase
VWHHLIDVADLTQSFDAAQFVRLANAAVMKIQARGHVPIFCGGTGLYFKGFLEGLGDAPPADEKLRAELERKPLAELLDELAKKDPVTFDEIDCNNPRRIVRAVEVIRLTGKPFSQQRSEWKSNVQSPKSNVIFGFARPGEDLRARIDKRVEAMFARGLVEETRRLLEGGLAQNKTAMQALGYRQVVEHLRGEHSLPETIELVKIKTRQFAKRQLTWFRNQLNLQWIELEREQELLSIAERIGNNR